MWGWPWNSFAKTGLPDALVNAELKMSCIEHWECWQRSEPSRAVMAPVKILT